MVNIIIIIIIITINIIIVIVIVIITLISGCAILRIATPTVVIAVPQVLSGAEMHLKTRKPMAWRTSQ